MRQSLVPRIVIASLLLSAEKDSAFAGAWLKPEGQSEIIFSTRISNASQRFDPSGEPIAIGKFSKIAVETIGEYGLNKDITLIAGIAGQGQKLSLFPSLQASVGWGGLAGGRMRIWSNDQSILSLQAQLEFSGERQRSFFPTTRFDPPAMADVRLLFGHGFTLQGIPAFVEFQTGYRWRGGSHADEVRIDMTFGLRPFSKFLLLFQSFNTIATHGDKRFQIQPARQHKLQASMVYELTQNLSLQTGGFANVAGRESLKERGALIALWWKL